jgi:hypothetical protein
MLEAELRWQSAGHEATSRCEAIEKAEEANAENADWERELRHHIPQPGSSYESPQLQRLRTMLEKDKIPPNQLKSNVTQSTARGNIDRSRQSITRERGADGRLIEIELYWSAKRLVWSRGGIAVRSFSYEEEITSACWAWMDSDSTWEASQSTGKIPLAKEEDQTSSLISSTPRGKSVPDSHWQGTAPKIARRGRRVFRALCIFLHSCLVIYHPHSGREFIKRLDMDVLNVFPLQVGILIQRKTEAEDRKRARMVQEGVPGAEPPLSTMFYLRRPYDELKGLTCVNKLRFSGTASTQYARVREGEKAQSFNELDERVFFVSISPPIVVSLSPQSGSLRIYSYAHDRAPFRKYEVNADEEISTLRKLDDDSEFQDIFKARRSTIEGQRNRPMRPKMPPRKSSRVESVSNRSSIGGPRSSVGVDRTRSISGTSHARRTSGGLPSIYGQNTLLHDEDEQSRNEEEGMHEMMQLLDEFDEVEEDGIDFRQQLSLMTPGQAPNIVSKRRTSRGYISTASTVPPSGVTLSTIANSLRTPFAKSRATEERRISRSRRSMLPGNTTESAPVSVAVELSQKDEASRIAMTANSDKTMSKGLGGDALGLSSDLSTPEGLSIFQEFAQGFAVMSLLEQVPIPEMNR